MANQGGLLTLSASAETALYGVTVIVIVLGAGKALFDGAREACKGEGSYLEHLNLVRLQLSGALSLGLTFLVGAEIVKTFRVPHWQQLVKVVILIMIRQLVTWSLDSDAEKIQKSLKASKLERSL